MMLGDVIAKYRAEHGLSQREFAIKCGLSNANIAMLEKNENPSTKRPIIPTLPTINKIAQGMDITVDELFQQADDFAVIWRRKQPIDPQELFNRMFANEEENKKKSEDLFLRMIGRRPEIGKVPLVGRIACGDPILAEENIEGYVDLPKYVNADYALKCHGDSMIEAGIEDGDIVYIRQQPEVENGQIAAVLIDGDEATLKRFYFDGQTVQLVAENPKFMPMVFTGEDINKVRVIGLAVAFTHTHSLL